MNVWSVSPMRPLRWRVRKWSDGSERSQLQQRRENQRTAAAARRGRRDCRVEIRQNLNGGPIRRYETPITDEVTNTDAHLVRVVDTNWLYSQNSRTSSSFWSSPTNIHNAERSTCATRAHTRPPWPPPRRPRHPSRRWASPAGSPSPRSGRWTPRPDAWTPR